MLRTQVWGLSPLQRRVRPAFAPLAASVEPDGGHRWQRDRDDLEDDVADQIDRALRANDRTWGKALQA